MLGHSATEKKIASCWLFSQLEELILHEYLKNIMYGRRINSSASGQDPPVEKNASKFLIQLSNKQLSNSQCATWIELIYQAYKY